MEQNLNKGNIWRNLIRRLCFIAFGITAFFNPLDKFNLYNLGFGIITGLFFGWLFKKFSRGFLGLFNPTLKKEQGKKVIYYAVDRGMMFLVPFAAMALISTFYLKWSMTGGFISTGIMSVGTGAAIEIGKTKGKQEIKNTMITSGVSFLFSFVWTLSAKVLIKMPGIIEGSINLLRSVLSKGGGLL